MWNVCQRRDIRGCEWRSVYWFHERNRHYSLHMKTYKWLAMVNPIGRGSLTPNQLLILNGLNTNLISRSVQKVLTNSLILRCLVIEQGPMYVNLKYEQLSIRVAPWEESEMKWLLRTFFNNILDDVRREQIPPWCFGKVIYIKMKASPSALILNYSCYISICHAI